MICFRFALFVCCISGCALEIEHGFENCHECADTSAQVNPASNRRNFLSDESSVLNRIENATGMLTENPLAQSSSTMPIKWKKLTDQAGIGENTCEGFEFAADPIFDGFCSSFLVTPRHVLTAGHCLTNRGYNIAGQDCRDIWVAFDVNAPDGNSEIETYQCAKVALAPKNTATMEFLETDEGGILVDFFVEDWALIQLTESVTDRQPLTLSNIEPSNLDKKNLQVMGFPKQQSTKVAEGVASNELLDESFVNQYQETTGMAIRGESNTITVGIENFSGYSGGPLFEKETGHVVGIVSRGSATWGGQITDFGFPSISLDHLLRYTFPGEHYFFRGEEDGCYAESTCRSPDTTCLTKATNAQAISSLPDDIKTLIELENRAY